MTPCRRHIYPKEGPRVCRRCKMPERPRNAASVASRGEGPVLVSTAAYDDLMKMLAGLNAAPTADTASHEEPCACPTTSSTTAAGPAPSTDAPANLPEHSPLGASSAERWMKCSGSTDLINQLRTVMEFQTAEDTSDPEWTADGIEAHEVAAYCLQNDKDAWEVIGDARFPRYTPALGLAVQEYLDLVRSFDGELRVEFKMHRPEIHPLFYGTADAVRINPGHIRVIDYKNGAGVYVEVERNPQLMYYAVGVIEELDVADDTIVDLWIVQPNAYTPDGVPSRRVWRISAGELRVWLRDELLPKMCNQDPKQFEMGEHCRFCPAKVACPAMAAMVQATLMTGVLPFDKVEYMKMLIKAAQAEEYKRLINGLPGTGGKLVQKKVDRVWKRGAEEALQKLYGRAAYTEPTLRSPAAIEALAFGKNLVAEWAYKPDGGLTVAPITDKRAEMRPRSSSEVFGAAVQRILDSR